MSEYKFTTTADQCSLSDPKKVVAGVTIWDASGNVIAHVNFYTRTIELRKPNYPTWIERVPGAAPVAGMNIAYQEF